MIVYRLRCVLFGRYKIIYMFVYKNEINFWVFIDDSFNVGI